MSDSALYQDGELWETRGLWGRGQMESKEGAGDGALFSHVGFEMYREIHGGGVTKALRNESGIQGEDGTQK